MGKEPSAKPLLSVEDVKPDEEGGPIARSGFTYQDEIAVSFFIEMLEDRSLVKVHCETHDDLVLVRGVGEPEMQLAEFVQVKAGETNKLWSVADLCARKKAKIGTSIFEKSLARDKHVEESHFRIVTLRPVVAELRLLTFPRDGTGREPDGKKFKALKSELDKRIPDLESLKGNGTAYWLENCLWDQRESKQAVQKDNLIRLIRQSGEEGRQLLLEPAGLLLDELRAWAKKAGDLKWEPDRDKKIITRDALRGWWELRTRELIEGAAAPSGSKLVKKMSEAELPTELVELAVELRRDYAAESRTSSYMEPEERKRLQSRVKSEIVSARACFAADELDLDGVGFHAHCLSRMEAINAERPTGSEDRSAFLKGCMYDIVDRCLHRFARLAP